MACSEFHENCGIAAVLSSKDHDVAPLTVQLAGGLQHRGQEGAGLGVKKIDGDFVSHRGSTRFGQIFRSEAVLKEKDLIGEIAIGHTRYRTTGASDDETYAQPMIIKEMGCTLMGGHNGNIANSKELYDELKAEGVIFDTEGNRDSNDKPVPVSDSEVLFRRLARATGSNWPEKIMNGLKGVEGAFSLVLATDNDELIALRDPWGIRPLSFGRLNGYWTIASETWVLDDIGVCEQREIDKGEMWVFKAGENPRKIFYNQSQPRKYCDFEDWYFSWPASSRRGIEIDLIREACGLQMAVEEIEMNRRVDADLVVCAPDTGRSSAIPFAERLGIPYRDRIFKKRYDEKAIGRSFMGSDDLIRSKLIENKYSRSRSLKGKVLYIVDDTGVRLTTMQILNRALKDREEVKEIHWRLPAPKFIRPCVLGTNINRREELGAVELRNGRWVVKDDLQMAREIGADSIAFLTMEGRSKVRRSFGENPNDFCGYCHGADNPPFDMSRYDKDLFLEDKRVAIPVLMGV